MDNFQRMLFRGGIPITTGLLVVNAVTFLLAFMFPNFQIMAAQWVACGVPDALVKPWTLITYPLVYLETSSQGFFNFLFGGFLFWSAGGSLERSWGGRRYALFFFATGLISALMLLGGSLLLKQPDILFGFFLPMACCVVAFCTIQPEETVMFFFFPIRAKYFAVIVTLFTWIYVGQGGRALLGVFALSGLLAAYLYVRHGFSSTGYGAPRRNARGPDLRMDTRPQRPTFRTTLDGSPQRRGPMDVAGRVKDWQERRRLERLWKNSGLPREEPDWRDDEKRRR